MVKWWEEQGKNLTEAVQEAKATMQKRKGKQEEREAEVRIKPGTIWEIEQTLQGRVAEIIQDPTVRATTLEVKKEEIEETKAKVIMVNNVRNRLMGTEHGKTWEKEKEAAKKTGKIWMQIDTIQAQGATQKIEIQVNKSQTLENPLRALEAPIVQQTQNKVIISILYGNTEDREEIIKILKNKTTQNINNMYAEETTQTKWK